MRSTHDRDVEAYLHDLDRALGDLPAKRRREIVSEIEEHIADMLAELPSDAGEAAVLNALDRVGDPDDIAKEARDRFGITRGRPSWSDPLAIVLLLVGGFLWLIGWIAGVVLLWISDVWSTRDKIIATLLVPGGLAAPFFLLLTGTSTSTCAERTLPTGVSVTTCSEAGADVLAIALLVFLVVASIGTAVFLGRTLRRARRLTE